jgi:hypothetical protein
MSFKVESASPTQSNPAAAAAASAKDRAVAAFMKSAAERSGTPALQNATSVSPEEVGAIGHTGSSEAPSQDAPAETQAKIEEQAPLSSQYAQLARKEKAIRAKAQEIRAKEDALRAREEAVKAKETPAAAPAAAPIPLKDRWSTGDVRERLAVLNELGASYDDVTQAMLNQPSQETSQLLGMVDELKSEIRALRGDQENSKKSNAEQQQRQYQQAVNQIRNEVKQVVDGSLEEFEAIKATSSQNDVVDLIERTFKEDGLLLTPDEACRQVEEYLVEEATKIARLKKIQSRIAAPQKQPESQQKQPQQTKTLTNAITAAKTLSSKERAILAFQGKLNR